MKKRAFSLFAMLMAMIVFAVPTLAEDANLETTALFIEYLDEEDYRYSYEGFLDNGFECIRMAFRGDNCDPEVVLHFDPDEDCCNLRVWNVIEYEEVMEPVILDVVNELNVKYKFGKWSADDDFSVTASLDVFLRPNEDMSETLMQAIQILGQVVDTCYPELEPYRA
jgi:hypothetical protein